MAEVISVVVPTPGIQVVGMPTPRLASLVLPGQGPAGPPGRDASTYRVTAPVALSGHRILAVGQDGTFEYASSRNPAHAYRLVGMTMNAAAAGDDLTVVFTGEVSEPSWNWLADSPIWLAANGLLSQVEPSVTSGDVFSVVIGFAMSPTKVFIRLQPPLILA